MSSIKNVAVIGGSGNLGSAVVQALLDAKFTVTALTRESSKATFPSGVLVHKTDYNSPASLAAALKGQEAVVAAITTSAIAEQKKIIDAAVAAGVKRFIPSEFGLDTTHLSGGVAKILGGKVEIQAHLKKVSEETKDFTWTGISTNLFFDWGLPRGSLGFSITDKAATIYDSGNEPFQASNLHTIGKAVASVLAHPAETANRYIRISSLTTTQNAILAAFEEETGTKWTVKKASTDDSLKLADEKLAKGDFSAFGDYLKVHFFKDGHGQGTNPDLANKELGLPEDDLKETIKRVLKS